MKKLSFLPIPALTVIIAVLHVAVPPSVFYDPAWLIPITNTLFVGVICFAVSYIAMRNYRATGRIQILLLGCGVLIFGIGGVIAGFVRGLPNGANLNVTIYNTGALVGALFHFVAAFILISGTSPEIGAERKGLWLATSYVGIFLFMALLTLADFNGLIPSFFIQSRGATPLRQAILGSADVLFAFSFLVFLAMYLRNKEIFLYWYALALALTSISLTAFFIQHSVGSPEGWAGRTSQYLAGVYFLIALKTAIRSAEARRTSFDNIITASLSPAEEKFRALAENSPDAICRFDRQLRHVYVNAAGLRLHGRPAAAVIGRTLGETGFPEPFRSQWEDRVQKVFETGRPIDAEDYLPFPDGPKFYQSRCVPEFGVEGSVENVLVVSHDLTERKRAESVLQEAHNRTRVVLESIADGFFSVDRSGNFTYVNKKAASFWKKDPADILGKSLWQMIPQAVGTIFDEQYHKAVSEQKPVSFEAISPSMGTWVEVRAYPSNDGLSVYFTDITERKKAEEAAIREKNTSDSIIESLPGVFYIFDSQGRFMKWNRNFEQVTGYTAAELSTMQPWDFFIGEDKHLIEQRVGEVFAKGESTAEAEFVTKDGRRIPYFFTGLQTLIGDRRCLMGMGMDITERKKAEGALKESEEQFRRAIEDAPIPVIMHAEDGAVLQISNSWTELTGYTLADLPTLDAWLNRAYGEGADLVRDHVRELFRGSKRTIDIEFPIRTSAGATRHWSFSASSPGTLSDGRRFVVGMAIDITERKKSEAELLQLTEDMARRNMELEALNKELEAFNYSISHDLRAPLRSMSGFSKIMLEDFAGKLDDYGKDYLTRIRTGSEKMTRLVDDLLHLSRISRQPIDRMDYDLSRLAEATVVNLRDSSPGRNVEVVIEPGVRAFVDPNLMRVVMTNLLDNAWKFTSKTDKARIEFGIMKSQVSSLKSQVSSSEPETRNSKPKTVFFVKDNGAGFDQQYAFKMFWPFHRLHTEKEFPGTGIGLAIVDRIIRRHGGRVWAEGEVGKGAVIYFTLGNK